MSKSIQDDAFGNQLETMMRDFVKEKLETVMKEEMAGFLHHEQPHKANSKNGFYRRSLDTQYGRIEDLSVPRDRAGQFQTELFEPHQRRTDWLEEAIIRMYQSGMSTREVGKFIERIIGQHYSPTTVSHITNAVLEDIREWQRRRLEKRYSVVYLDGLYVKVRRDTVAKEAIYVVLGITEDGHREILGFYVGGQESSNGWREVLQDLYRRGLQEVLLGIFDGLPHLEEAFREIYPKADVQRCVVHKVRNTVHQVRKQDRTDICEDLKLVYNAVSKEAALKHFEDLKTKWGPKYKRVIQSWEDDLSVLLTFMDYPSEIQQLIYTTNVIERTIKEIRKRFKTMNSLTSIEAAEKMTYLVVQDYNDKWSSRISQGFKSAYNALQRMFQNRYGQ